MFAWRHVVQAASESNNARVRCTSRARTCGRGAPQPLLHETIKARTSYPPLTPPRTLGSVSEMYYDRNDFVLNCKKSVRMFHRLMLTNIGSSREKFSKYVQSVRTNKMERNKSASWQCAKYTRMWLYGTTTLLVISAIEGHAFWYSRARCRFL